MTLHTRSLGALAVLVAGLVAAPAAAQEKPFRVVGAGVGPEGLPLPGEDPGPHWAVGTATGLGKYYGIGSVETLTAVPQADGTITGTFGSGPGGFVFSGANKKDVLATDYGRAADNPGTFTLYPTGNPGEYVAVWVADFVVDPDRSAGKFAGATGRWTMIAKSEPFVLGSDDPVAYSWEGSGTLTFPRKARKK